MRLKLCKKEVDKKSAISKIDIEKKFTLKNSTKWLIL